MKTAVLATIALVLIIVSGVGGFFIGGSTAPSAATATTTQTTTTTITGQADPSKSLAQNCQAEGGKATFYSVIDTSDWPTMNAVLMKDFPFMQVNFVGEDPQGTVNKVNSEYQAGHVVADVVQDSLALLVQLKTSGALQPYDDYVMDMDNYSSSFVDTDHVWHAFVVAPLALLYNTNLVTDTSTLPKTWSDLANPIWKNKIVMDNPNTLNVAGITFATLFPIMGNSSWTALMQGIAANDPVFVSSGADAYTSVSSGQYPLAMGFINDYMSGVGTGAPVKPVNINPTVVLIGATGLATNNPHPYCGRLLLQWLESYSGQAALAMTHRGPAYPTLTNTYYTGVYPSNTQFIVAATGVPTFFTDSQYWVNLYTKIFG